MASSDEELRLTSAYLKRLRQLEDGAAAMTRETLRSEVGKLVKGLKKPYQRLADATSEEEARRATSSTAKQINNVVLVSEEFLPASTVDRWSNTLAGYMEKGDALGRQLAARLTNSPREPRTNGTREQLLGAAADAGKRLDYEAEELRKAIAPLVEMGVDKGWGPKRLETAIHDLLGGRHGRHDGLSWKAEVLSRTELAAAYLEAQQRMTKRLGYDYARWVAAEDERTCPFCASRSGLIYRASEMFLPAHPLCRCAMVPVPNSVVEAEDAELLNEEGWGQHREEVLADFLMGKLRGLNTAKARAAWTVDRAWAELDKYRQRPTAAERALGLEASARPVRVLGDAADPTINWRDPGPGPGDLGNPLMGIGNADRETTGEMYNVAPPADEPIDERQQLGRSAQASAVGTAGLQQLEKQAGQFNAELQRKGEAQRSIFEGQGDAAAHKRTSVAAQQAGLAKLEAMKPGMDKIYAKAKQTPLSAAQVAALVDGVEIKGASANELKGIRQNLKEFVEVFNGGGITPAGANRVRSINIIDADGSMDDLMGLSTFNSKTGEVTIPRPLMQRAEDGGRALLWHEMGHAMEVSDPQLLQRQLDWIKDRSPDTGPTFFQSGYGPDDLSNAYRDKFINSYVGRVYEEADLPADMDEMDRLLAVMEDSENVEAGQPRKLKYKEFGTESISVAVEYFSSPKGRAELWARDRDLFDLVMDLTQEKWD